MGLRLLERAPTWAYKAESGILKKNQELAVETRSELGIPDPGFISASSKKPGKGSRGPCPDSVPLSVIK